MTDFQPAFADAELSDNDSRAVTIGGQKVLICRAGGTLYAVENGCTHQDAELGGRMKLLYLMSAMTDLRCGMGRRWGN